MTRSTHSFQTWKQSIIVKFAFDLSSFVSSTLVVSGVAAIGAVGLHRSRDQLVAPKVGWIHVFPCLVLFRY